MVDNKPAPQAHIRTPRHALLRTAADIGKGEFDPTTETHHHMITVKLVDPGCTTEVQIEERSGRVTRLTTTDNTFEDRLAIHEAVTEAVNRMLDEQGL